ncbi:hypothetical protein BN946_scf184719.g2 [Trametes cinnabarina]|uniref:Uncharacterized protein n=1 Tax=Pycnoporus cinnabarinus TaxID=5643 RepID=A0A060SUR9_PYCCI|nr:hypothetical protein BN946_scf184719.g2 [Trametes cinnabarina]
MQNPEVQKAMKLRLWCLQVPLPKIAPIIGAAIAIPSNLSTTELVIYSEKILRGLLSSGLHVVSCSHDGTETEHGVQRQLAQQASDRRSYKIPCPDNPSYDLSLTVPVFEDQPVVFVQDSKHARKTYRNNQCAGGRLITIGNTTVLYRRIWEVAFEDDSPLYHRDVEKLDRQDDNAAARLFSAETLEYIIKKHPDYLGEIVYLFVFGELVDAWQSRSIPHIEHIKMALRAHYFVKMWETYLDHAGYVKSRHCLSREALDITQILVESVISLILVHRDYSSSHAVPFPLALWLHSTEPCEHVFGSGREVVEDFTFLDFHFMVSKLYIKLSEAAKLGVASDPKARASGYNHTYLDTRNIDLHALSTYPDDELIDGAAVEAFEEAESLIALLGIIPSQLHACLSRRTQKATTTRSLLPPISLGNTTAFQRTPEDDEEEEALDPDAEFQDDVELSAAAELQGILQSEESSQWEDKRTSHEDDHFMTLAMASVSMSMDDMCRIAALPAMTRELQEEMWAENCRRIGEAFAATLPRLDAPEGKEMVIGKGSFTISQLDLSNLSEVRRQHQTCLASEGVRTRSMVPVADSVSTPLEKSVRREIICEFYSALRKLDERGVSSGKNRQRRWCEGDGTKEDSSDAIAGNSANAAAVAAASANAVMQRCKAIFLQAGLPKSLMEHVVDARISQLQPLHIGSYALTLVDDAHVTVSQVLAIYVKSGGKQARHCSVEQCSTLGAVSYISVQVYEHVHGPQFRDNPQATSLFRTKRFLHLPSISFLWTLTSQPTCQGGMLLLGDTDYRPFTSLSAAAHIFSAAAKLFRKRSLKAATEEES